MLLSMAANSNFEKDVDFTLLSERWPVLTKSFFWLSYFIGPCDKLRVRKQQTVEKNISKLTVYSIVPHQKS